VEDARGDDGRPGPQGILAVASAIGRSAWLEDAVFAGMGAAQGRVDAEVLVALFARHVRQHAWHAEVWRERLPELREIAVDALVVAPTDGIDDVIERLSAAAGEVPDAAVAAGWYRTVVPYLVTRYDELAPRLTVVADDPVRRWLGFVVADEVTAWREGESVVRRLATDPDAVREVARFQADLEALLVARR
jgi:hypothetical protein